MPNEHKSTVTNDHKELAASWGTSILEGYKVLMACLLSVFVPQFCPETNQTCTLSENFSNLTPYNAFVIAFNFLTLVFFLRLYYLQNKREAYLITHLDADRHYPVTGLEERCQAYPKVVQRVAEHNQHVLALTKRVLWLFYLNVVLSAVLVCHFFYDGFRTVTTLIANVLLVTSKLYNMWSTLTECVQDNQVLALSTYSQQPVGFNVLDDKWIARKRSGSNEVVELTAMPPQPPAQPSS